MYVDMWRLTAALSGMKRSPRTSTSREAIAEASPTYMAIWTQRKDTNSRAQACRENRQQEVPQAQNDGVVEWESLGELCCHCPSKAVAEFWIHSNDE